MKRKRWEHAVGSRRQHRVVVYEREPGGQLYARTYDPGLRAGKGGMRRVSLGHRDRELARRYAAEHHAKLVKGEEDHRAERITLARLIALFLEKRKHPDPEEGRRSEMWVRVLGAGKDPHRISEDEWDSFIEARSSGMIDSHGQPVPEGKRRIVRARAIQADLQWVKAVLRWGANRRFGCGYLLREVCVRGYQMPVEKNPRRPLATQARYELLRQQRVGYIPELLDIANGTGRRLSAVCSLRYEDLRLNDGTPFGSIRWPADTDKIGLEATVPVGPEVRAAVDRVLAERPGIGAAYMFPSPGNPAQPVSRFLAHRWLRRAEQLAGLESLKGSLWHAYRRGWATARKHLPDVDVAAAGGWKDLRSLKTAYQQADQETMLRVVLEAGELRERRR